MTEVEVSNNIRGINRDQAEDQLRRLAKIQELLEGEYGPLDEVRDLIKERAEILRKWLD